MSIPRRIIALFSLLSAFAVLVTAPVTAFADEAPPGSGGFTPSPAAPTVITHSSPAWTFVLVALAAAVVTAAALLAVEHYRHSHIGPTPA